MSINKISLSKIVLSEIMDNQILVMSTASLISALVLAQVVFARNHSEFVANFPDKATDLTFKSIFIVLWPYFLSEFLIYAGEFIDAHTFPRMERDVITKLLKNVVNSAKFSKKELNANELILNLKKIFDIREIYHLTISYIVPSLITTIALAYYFINADKNYGIIVTLILVVTLICLSKLSLDCSKFTEVNEKNTNEFFDDEHDVLNNIEHVIVAGMEKKEEERTNNRQNLLKKSFVLKNTNNANLRFVFSMTYLLIMVLLDAIAIYLYHQGKIDKVTLIAIIYMNVSLVGMYSCLIYELHNITKSIGSYNEVDKYFSQYEYENSNLIQEMKINSGKIEFQHIKLKYGNKQIYDDLNLTIEPNSKVSIVGEIGSGKSTLLKLLIGLVNYEGTILIDGLDIAKYDHLAFVKNVAYIPQIPKLFNRTVLENLNYGSNYSEKEITDILNNFGVLEVFTNLKDGLKTNVGKNGEKLSGGQRQLLYILRSFIQNKKIILFDEPTSSLDAQNRKHLKNIISKFNDKTILMVTHDKDMLDLFDRTIVFDSGKIIKDTKYKNLDKKSIKVEKITSINLIDSSY